MNCSDSTLINPPIIASSARLKSIVESSKLSILIWSLCCIYQHHCMYIEIVHQRIHPKPTLNVFYKSSHIQQKNPLSRGRRSDITPFKFKDQCLICGDTCLKIMYEKNVVVYIVYIVLSILILHNVDYFSTIINHVFSTTYHLF